MRRLIDRYLPKARVSMVAFRVVRVVYRSFWIRTLCRERIEEGDTAVIEVGHGACRQGKSVA